MARLHRICLSLGASVCLVGCRPETTTSPDSSVAAERQQTHAPSVVPVEREKLEAHVRFLADDAQEGRAPGTEADRRVQAYVAEQMREAGLEPGFEGDYRQSLTVTDGVRVREGAATKFEVGTTQIEHALLPFAGRGEPVVAPLVFVGHGIARQGAGTGDYEGIEENVRGKIAVALHGAPDDPHLNPAQTRPQSKLIAARDHGAVGFILWEPSSDLSYPNSGDASDLKLPAVFVGKAGTPALLKAFGAKGAEDVLDALRPGQASRTKATLATPVEPVELETANVMGVLPGSGEGRVVVIGAHMDHLGEHSRYSLAPGEREVHNGADDNASGVAAMLEVCRSLARLPAQRRPFDVWCIAFAAEEMGLLGSKHFVETLPEAQRERIVAMFNFDMVGRLRDELTVAGAGTSSVWPRLLAAEGGDLPIQTTPDGFGPSDHGSFYEYEIPVLHFFTGTHEDYHKPSDDIDKIDFVGLERISGLALRMVAALQRDATVPDYLATKRPQPRGGSFRVAFGTMPDYGADVDGVKLSGVREGGPAAIAGLRKGDVIVRVGKREIHNLDDYMATFNVLEPGEPVDFEIERDGEHIVVQVTPSGR